MDEKRKLIYHGEYNKFEKVDTLCGIFLFVSGHSKKYYIKHYKTIITTKNKNEINCKNCLKTNKFKIY